MSELHSIEELHTPNGQALLRGYDSDDWRWSFFPEDQENPSRWYASVTGILDIVVPKKLQSWWAESTPEKIKEKSGKALDRGTKIHKAIAEGKNPKVVAERLRVLGSEVSVYSPALGFAGTIDAVGILDEVKTVIDFKSGRNYGIKTGWQLGAYREMWRELMGEELAMAGVHMPPDGGEQKVFKYVHIDACFIAFLATLDIFRMLNWTKLARMKWAWLNTPYIIPAPRMEASDD